MGNRRKHFDNFGLRCGAGVKRRTLRVRDRVGGFLVGAYARMIYLLSHRSLAGIWVRAVMIATIMVAAAGLSWWLMPPASYLPESAKLVKAARLPMLFGTRIHVGVVIAVLLVPVILYILWNTPLGFRLRAVGSKQSVAKYAGINVNGTILFGITFSGALCGLAGLIDVSTYHYRLKGSISSGYGFTAILVALLGRMHPVGVMFAAVFFAALDVGAQSMHSLYGLPITLADAIRAIIVLSVLAADSLARRRKN